MKIANAKRTIAKFALAALAAGAFILAVPPAAQAQGFAVGVQVGAQYYAPRRDFAFERRQEFLRREAFLRHEEWLRAHRRFGYR